MIKIIPFGTTKDGCDVSQIGISSDLLAIKILTLGGVLNYVRLNGVPWPLTLGSSELAAYEEKMSSFGLFCNNLILLVFFKLFLSKLT